MKLEDLQPTPVQFAYPKSYAKEAWMLLHWPRALFIYVFITIGALLAPVVRVDILLWTYLGIFLGVQVCAYRLDQLRGHHMGVTAPDEDHVILAVVGFTGGLLVFLYIVVSTSWWALLWLIPALLGIVGYNFEVGGKAVHNMMVFGFTWGFVPIVSSYTFHGPALHDAGVLAPVAFGAFAWVLAAVHLWSYGMTKCRHSDVCDDHARDRGTTMCHGQICQMRLTMPKSVNRLAWTLIRLQLALAVLPLVAVAAVKYLG